MRKLKEVLRLRYELGLGQRQIARSCSIGHGTVYEYLKRAQAAGVAWPLPDGWDDRQLDEALFGPAPRRIYESRKPAPDFAFHHEEPQRHPHLTLRLAWPPSRLLRWAQSVGPGTAQLFAEILQSKPHPEMGYRSCLGILRLDQRYARERVEAAAVRAIATGACSYHSVKSILEHGLDRLPLDPSSSRPPLEHPNLRRAAHFDPQTIVRKAGEENLC